ncbi:precorrin-6A synthase (deacetylating) [Corynebacterium hansenii]|uniref:Precorrin-6A synthase (Deacetylating) n=1 Tax=Corynebacterium hansenii TaxID=394964 RepID=A0ABV7ZSR0_9CORY|nr:precorrin-6A synthase (deacetylating) [Corynebacterium hansenii]WJZ00856.1 precorrin 6A synthase [Corynebacterium hansenii]
MGDAASAVLAIDVIGMGAGSPAHLTLEAIEALRGADVVFALDKGEAKSDLLDARRAILAAHAPHVELVAVPDPPRDRDPADYGGEVRDWHRARAELLHDAMVRSLTADDRGPRRGAFLVWGDPSLYDSTLRILDRIRGLGATLDVRVIPGITAVQALTAAHATTLNRIGRPVLVTTGRRLGERPAGTDAVVMLDGGAAWLDHAADDEEILWGAYLGTPMQELRRGRVGDIGAELADLKAALRAERGWIMDIYLLRPAGTTDAGE